MGELTVLLQISAGFEGRLPGGRGGKGRKGGEGKERNGRKRLKKTPPGNKFLVKALRSVSWSTIRSIY